MKLTFYRGDVPNFGDELNAFMWDRLLPPGFLDEDGRELFVGIGSIIWDSYPDAASDKAIKHVMGSGYGGYTAAPDMTDGSWDVVWIRGPLTAQRLGLDPALAITDAAVLLRAIDLPPPAAPAGPAFMPHFQSIDRGNWQRVCELAGVTYLDPRRDPLELIAQIRAASVLITEAMHGAIVADALRVPFIAMTPTHPNHRYKWDDWAKSVDLPMQAIKPILSSPTDAYVRFTGRWGEAKRSKAILTHPLMTPVATAITYLAAENMRRIVKKTEPQLSSDATISRLTERSLEAVERFVKTHS